MKEPGAKRLPKESLDEVVESRYEGEKGNSAYSLPVREVDRVVAPTPDFKHTSIQQWIEANRSDMIKKPTQECEWTSDTVIDRYFHPDGMPPLRDAPVVRVVLKYLPDGHPPYSIVYPREALSG